MRDLKHLVGTTIEYTKSGGRYGWIGVIEKVSNHGKIHVLYTNGVEQSYDYTALEEVCEEFGYLRKHTDDEKPNLWLVVRAGIGDVVGTHTSIEKAEKQAYERTKVTQASHVVYAPKIQFKRNIPPVSRLEL